MPAPALRIPVQVDMEQFKRSMKDMGETVHQESEHIEGHFKDINGAASIMGTVLKAAVGGASIGALLGVVTSLAKIGDLGDDLRLPVNLIQALSVAADEARVPATMLTSALEKFTEASKAGGKDAEKFETALGNVGKSFLKAFQDAETQQERLRIISNALKSTTDEVKRAQLSLQAFGTDNERLIAVLGSGADSFDRYIENVKKLGLEIDVNLVKQAQEAKSQLLLLTRVLTDQFSVAIADLIPTLIKLLPYLQAIALAGQAVGAIFGDDATASTKALQSEMEALTARVARLRQLQDDLAAAKVSKADSIRDKIREILGINVPVEQELKAVGEEIAQAEKRLADLEKLLAAKAAGATKSNKPAFEPREPLTDKGGGRDRFEAAAESIEKRTAALDAETRTIDLGTEARNRARIAAELETIAKQVNKEAGLGANIVTAEQTRIIDEFSAAFGRAAAAMEQARSPLATFARESANTGMVLNRFAATSLDTVTNELANVVTGTKTAAEAFRAMALSIINDLAKIAIRSAITGPIAKGLFSAFGGVPTGDWDPGAGLAAGTDNWRGGPTWVGENGPEIVNLPKGSQVIPNNIATKGASGSSSVVYAPTYHFDAGIGPADMALIQVQIRLSEQRTRGDVTNIVRGTLRNDRDALNR